MTPEELRECLGRLNLSQVDAAEALGVHPRTVRRWASGQRSIPRIAERLLAKLRPRAEDPSRPGPKPRLGAKE